MRVVIVGPASGTVGMSSRSMAADALGQTDAAERRRGTHFRNILALLVH